MVATAVGVNALVSVHVKSYAPHVTPPKLHLDETGDRAADRRLDGRRTGCDTAPTVG